MGLVATMLACAKGEDSGDNRPPPTPEAGYVVLKAETVLLTTELAGRISAFETSEVRPQVSGVIKARLFTEGAIVNAGETLYQIDASLYQASAAEARANLASAIATQTAAAARAERFRPLAEIEAISQQDHDDARAAADQASAAVAQQRAALDTANINLQFTRVPAPITGRIGRSIATTGALVTAGQAEPLTTIQRLDPIFVDIQQSSADLLALRRALASGGAVPASAQVRLILPDGNDYALTGTLQFTESVVDPSTGTVTLRAHFPNPEGLLLPGMYVRALLTQSQASAAILAPQQGITRDPGGDATALIVGPDDKALLRDVVTERAIGDQWLITNGLSSGDRLIVEGLGRIKPGQSINPVPVELSPLPPPRSASTTPRDDPG